MIMCAQNHDAGARSTRSRYLLCSLAAAALAVAAYSPVSRAEDAPASPSVTAGGGAGSESIQVGLGGQYRINAYSARNDIPDQDNQTAARVRIRQNVDVRFDEQFRTHVQLELGHTTSNVSTTDVTIGVRHAVLDYTSRGGLSLQAGIVPLADRFGDVLFSSDWNYNPVAAAITVPISKLEARAFAGKLLESMRDGTNNITGGEEFSGDDTTHYQLDLMVPAGARVQLNAGGSFVQMSPDTAPPFRSRNHVNYGAGARVTLATDLAAQLFVLGSNTNGAIVADGNGDASGAAAKLELTGKLGPGKFGVLASHATGDDDGSGFIPVQALVKTNGYWGYTGILTVQGPTDTGFDGDSVNVANNGYGMTSVQVRYSTPIVGKLSGYAAAGWFGNANTPAGRSGDVGVDVLLLGTYRFNRVLAMDFGGGFARIEDGASGYDKGVAGAFNQEAGTTRNKAAVVARMQAEF
jgi:hypothetical protein